MFHFPYENVHRIAHFEILLQLLFWKVEHMFGKKSSTFSFATLDDEWISLSLKTISKPWWTLSLSTKLAQIWCNKHQQRYHMKQWWLLKKTWSYAKRALGNDFTPLVVEMYECFHFHFDSFLTICAQTIIMCHHNLF